MRAQRLSRSLTDRALGGVCGGLGAVIGISAWWIRAAFILLTVSTSGTGALLYLALWLLLPAQRLAALPTGRDHVQVRALHVETVLLIGVVLVAAGLLALARNLDVLSADLGAIWAPLIVIAFGLIFLVKQLRRTV